MILTVLVNPCLIRQIKVSAWKSEAQNKILEETLAIGDSGVYSAHIIKILQGEPFVIGFSGGIGGRFIKNFLDKRRIVSDLTSIDSEPRMLTIMSDQAKTKEFTFTSNGYEPEETDLKALKHKFHNHIRECETVIFAGRLLSAQAFDKAEEVLSMIEEGQKAVVQASADNIELLSKYRPYAVVTDLEALRRIGIDGIWKVSEAEKLQKWMLTYKIKYFFVQTPETIYGFSRSKIAYVSYPPREKAEDIIQSSILGGIAIGVQRNYLLEKNLQIAGAIAAQINIRNFPDIIKRKEIDQAMNQVKVKEVYSEKKGFTHNSATGGN
ncbi:hypothetical protein EII17_00420 [Clostridiales bacterium COT073_COT-073]|nr:hypothetical protein EII17_00420 [Clostridiales bacterium COT073_COT-073]